MDTVANGHYQQCDYVSMVGQCTNRREPQSTMCKLHERPRDIAGLQKNKVRNYRLTKYRSRLEEFTDSPEVKSLREEIGIARITLEEIMNSCKDAYDITINSQRISQLVDQINKLVVSCDRLETRMDLNLDKSSAIVLAEQIVQIISNRLPETELEIVSMEIATAVFSMTKMKKD